MFIQISQQLINRFAAKDSMTHLRTGTLQRSRSAFDATIDVSTSILDSNDGHDQLGYPRHQAQRVCRCTGVYGSVVTNDDRLCVPAVANDDHRRGRARHQPLSGTTDVNRLQKTPAAWADHKEIRRSHQRNSRVLIDREQLDFFQVRLRKSSTRVRRRPPVRSWCYCRRFDNHWVQCVNDFQPPLWPGMAVDPQPSKVGGRRLIISEDHCSACHIHIVVHPSATQ